MMIAVFILLCHYVALKYIFPGLIPCQLYINFYFDAKTCQQIRIIVFVIQNQIILIVKKGFKCLMTPTTRGIT